MVETDEFFDERNLPTPRKRRIAEVGTESSSGHYFTPQKLDGQSILESKLSRARQIEVLSTIEHIASDPTLDEQERLNLIKNISLREKQKNYAEEIFTDFIYSLGKHKDFFVPGQHYFLYSRTQEATYNIEELYIGFVSPNLENVPEEFHHNFPQPNWQRTCEAGFQASSTGKFSPYWHSNQFEQIIKEYEVLWKQEPENNILLQANIQGYLNSPEE